MLPLRRFCPALCVLVPALVACSSGTDSDEDEPRPTLIVVGPEDFLGTLTCRTSGIETYSVRLEDVTGLDSDAGLPDAGPSVPPPTPPQSSATPCEQSVVFGCRQDPECRAIASEPAIAPGREYRAEITFQSGTDTWEPVLCEPVRAAFRQTRRPRCPDVMPPGGVGTGSIEVRLDGALGDLVCGAEGGQVASFNVYRDGEEIGSAACADDEATQGVDESVLIIPDVADGEVVTLELFAFGSGAVVPSFWAVCVARAIANGSVTATCDPLAATGAIAIDVAAAVEASGAACDARLVELRLDPVPENAALARTFMARACGTTPLILGLAPGSYTFTATAVSISGEVTTATCSAEVESGLERPLVCEPS